MKKIRKITEGKTHIQDSGAGAHHHCISQHSKIAITPVPRPSSLPIADSSSSSSSSSFPPSLPAATNYTPFHGPMTRRGAVTGAIIEVGHRKYVHWIPLCHASVDRFQHACAPPYGFCLCITTCVKRDLIQVENRPIASKRDLYSDIQAYLVCASPP
jgi:hypothetical protein